MSKPRADQRQRDLDKAARLLLSMREGADGERPSPPNEADANRRFRAAEKGERATLGETE